MNPAKSSIIPILTPHSLPSNEKTTGIPFLLDAIQSRIVASPELSLEIWLVGIGLIHIGPHLLSLDSLENWHLNVSQAANDSIPLSEGGRRRPGATKIDMGRCFSPGRIQSAVDSPSVFGDKSSGDDVAGDTLSGIELDLL